MDGLRTARVLVLDDEIKEATPFMEALAQRGIGSIYFSENEDALPAESDKLTGIRLAAIDMDLDGAGDDVRIVIPRLIGLMNRLIAADNGPYLAIAWTKHDDYVAPFRERSRNELDCPPIEIISMPKQDYGDIEAISRKIDEAIAQCYPLNLLGFWEQSIHESSDSVMQILPNTNDWIIESKKTLRLLLDAAADRGSSQKATFMALMSALNTLQLDAIETAAMNQEDDAIYSLVSPLNDVHVPKPTEEDKYKEFNALKAALNYRLLCTDPAPGIAPGNIYSCDVFDATGPTLFPKLGRLVFDAASRNNNAELREAGCVRIAMEITPLCDYQQGKQGFPRFICGLAVPMDHRSLLDNKALFLRQTEPIALETSPLEGNMVLVWDSHYTVSAPKELFTNGSALIRLRQAPLIDVQAWLGSQSNRPGYLSIQVRDAQ